MLCRLRRGLPPHLAAFIWKFVPSLYPRSVVQQRTNDLFLRNDPPPVSGDACHSKEVISSGTCGTPHQLLNALFVFSPADLSPVGDFPYSLFLEDDAMDYDENDTLLYHIFREVSHH
jgi:hypothetical protein